MTNKSANDINFIIWSKYHWYHILNSVEKVRTTQKNIKMHWIRSDRMYWSDRKMTMNGRKPGEKWKEWMWPTFMYSWLCTMKSTIINGTYIGHFNRMIIYKNGTFCSLFENSNRVGEMWPCGFNTNKVISKNMDFNWFSIN